MASMTRPWVCWLGFFNDQSVDFNKTFTKDEILTHATIYWINQAIGTSIRAYKNANRYRWQPSHSRKPAIEAPVGFTFLTGDAYPPMANVENRVAIFNNGPTAEWYNTIYAKAIPKADTLAFGKTLKPSLKASEKHFVLQTLANIRNRKHNVRTQRSRMGINIHRNTCRILFWMEPSNTYIVKPGGCLWQ